MSGALSNNEFKEKNDKYNIQISKIDDKIIELMNAKKNFNDIDKKNKKCYNNREATRTSLCYAY